MRIVKLFSGQVKPVKVTSFIAEKVDTHVRRRHCARRPESIIPFVFDEGRVEPQVKRTIVVSFWDRLQNVNHRGIQAEETMNDATSTGGFGHLFAIK